MASPGALEYVPTKAKNIYENADTVIAWLGESDDSTERGLNLMKKIRQVFKEHAEFDQDLEKCVLQTTSPLQFYLASLGLPVYNNLTGMMSRQCSKMPGSVASGLYKSF